MRQFALMIFFIIFSIHAIAQEDPVVKYGVSSSAPIDQGFIFCDGQYVEAPYIVQRRGLELFINNKKVGNAPIIPPDWRCFADPGLPPPDLKPPDFIPGINDTYWSKKYRYFLTKTNCNQTSAHLEYINTIRSIPGVIILEENEKHVIFKYPSGEKGKVSLFTHLLDLYEPYPTREMLIASVESTKDYYVNWLLRNDALFFIRTSNTGLMGYASALKAVSALVASDSPEKRYSALQNLGIRLDKDQTKDKLCNMRISPQLKVRYERIKTEIENERVARQQKVKADALARAGLTTASLNHIGPIRGKKYATPQ